ncbi:MAG: DeoR family transcriptional regulator [Sphaerochaetaceae bacterium]|nr:DeoR family transcriptional regulator [Sphaerochaetaceae bacterium]
MDECDFEVDPDSWNFHGFALSRMRMAVFLKLARAILEVTVEEYSRQYGVAPQTARNDLRRLCELGYVREFPFNKRKSGFKRADAT